MGNVKKVRIHLKNTVEKVRINLKSTDVVVTPSEGGRCYKIACCRLSLKCLFRCHHSICDVFVIHC